MRKHPMLTLSLVLATSLGIGALLLGEAPVAAPAEAPAEVVVVTSGGLAAAYDLLAPRFETATGIRLVTAHGASTGGAPDSIPARLARGERFDVLIMSQAGLNELTARGLVRSDTRLDLASSSIGMAVRSGASLPDVSTPEAFAEKPLAAESIGYSASVSGTYVSTELFPRLGLAEQLAPKSRRIDGDRDGRGESGRRAEAHRLSVVRRRRPDDRRNRSRAVGAPPLTRADRGEPMTTYTRKEFLGLSAVLAGGAGLARLPVAAAQEPAGAAGPADLAVINARVYTVDDALPRAQAFAVRGDRFTAVGSTDDVRNLVDPGTEVIDAEGMTVTPGFIDTHSHPSGVNELYGVNTNLRTVAEIQAALRTKALDTPPGRWVRGFMFDDTKVVDGPLHRTHLDAAVPDHPVNVAHRGGHTNWFNNTAFALAGVTRDTPDPPDGRFARDPDGALSGMVAEHARDVFADVGEREDLTEEEQRARAREGMAYISRLMTAAGLTTVHDAGASRGRLVAYQDAREAGELRHRVYAMVRGPYRALRNAGVYTGLGDEWVRIGGVKYSADGSASERTMRMSTPFEGRPDDYGILTMSQDEIHEAVEEAHRSNWQVGIHANGDVTIDMVLNAYERVLDRWPHPDRRHRIEHCSLVNRGLLRRIRDTGSIPTPFWTYVHFHGEKWREYGAAKMEWMFAHRSFLDFDIPVPGASDYTPGPFEPLMAIQSMVTRRDFDGRVWGPSQRVTVDEALRIGTLHGARASYEERDKGSITAGKLADFVILERDPHDADPDDIKNIGVVRTVVGGRTMHPATA